MNASHAANNRTPFNRILVANRGEIAIRIMRTAKRLGFQTVAVYSTVDAIAPHVAFADQAVCIGEALPSQSYLRIDAIVRAAQASGADAVHPGYGFLAENAEFAEACREAGLVFIGPSPDAIRAMGHKAGAKHLMLSAGVPCVPGYQGSDQGVDTLLREARLIGFPVMIKAVAGGGGRGMRLVAQESDFLASLANAKSEALNAFGDDSVILERAILNPRHIEIQILGDRYGHAIHLGERDCSIQRRHQKLIEEAPSPAVSPLLRANMGATAVAAVKALGYEGAGTLEFLLDSAGNFYFMEMNTRLQVEHPVTEAITGLDLVEMQLRLAQGDPLAIQQSDVVFSGHAIEARLCAEDPGQDFIPQSGRMLLWRKPEHVRVDDAMHSGCDIPPFYDSMIAKVISFASSRDEARRKLVGALQDLGALGVTTNREFLVRCLDHTVFRIGQATTAFISNNAESLQSSANSHARESAISAVLLFLSNVDPRHDWIGRKLRHRMSIPMRFEIGGKVREVALVASGESLQAVVEEEIFSFDKITTSESVAHFACNGVRISALFIRDGSRLHFQCDGHTVVADDLSFVAATKNEVVGADGKLRASMSGRVSAVLAKQGQTIAKGDPVVVLEAMKMQHVHAAPISGTVVSINVSEGDQVATRFVVAEIEAAP